MNLPQEFAFAGGTIIDGTGRKGFAGDVVVTDGRIRLASPGGTKGLTSFDVTGLAISPGFIDTHSHADIANLLGDDKVHEARIVQGVTTEVVGNCGLSPFPVPLLSNDMARQFMSIVFGPDAVTYPDLDAFATDVERAGLPSNIAPLVGHGTLRATAMGYENRAASASELDSMCVALARAMEAGAFGLSTGLCYTPATYAPSEEIEALAAIVAEANGIYSTHIRNETSLTAQSLTEAIAVARVTGVDLHISHLKVAGPNQWHTSSQILSHLDVARESGVRVTADVYPYTAASTALHSLLPPWTAEGGIEVLTANLNDREWRDRVDYDLRNGVPGWQNLGSAAGWNNVSIATSELRPEWEGCSIAALAENRDRPVDTVARVLLANSSKVVVVIEAMDPDDMVAFLSWPHSMVGSDGIPLPGKPHPRLTGTFPRVLGRHADDLGSIEMAVHRMTGASASRFSIPQRGTVTDGSVADLVVFDPQGVRDRGTYSDPWIPPEGIAHVLVGGTAAVWDATVVDTAAGSVLRPGR
jgi:dihydroorotase/N-acyl-D-amino-acid deacylase